MRLLTTEQYAQANKELDENLLAIDREIAIAIYELRVFANKTDKGRREILQRTIRLLNQLGGK
jgi:hypothetical protein